MGLQGRCSMTLGSQAGSTRFGLDVVTQSPRLLLVWRGARSRQRALRTGTCTKGIGGALQGFVTVKSCFFLSVASGAVSILNHRLQPPVAGHLRLLGG